VVRGMPSLARVRRADRCDSSTNRMISSFSDAGYLIRGRPHPLPGSGLFTNHERGEHAFFEQAEFERLLSHNFLQITGFTAQILYLVGACSTRRITGQPPLASFHKILGPFVIHALGNAFAAT